MPRIKDLTELTTAELANEDELAISDTSANMDKKLKISSLIAKILGGKVPGGGAGTDITLNSAVQVLSNKKLTSPKINSDIELLATSSEINKLAGLNVTKSELGALSGIQGNIQAQLNTIAQPTLPAFSPRYYAATKTPDSSGDINIEAATIRTAIDLKPSQNISSRLSVSCWSESDNPAPLITAGVSVSSDTGNILSKVNITGLAPGKSYAIFIVCAVV